MTKRELVGSRLLPGTSIILLFAVLGLSGCGSGSEAESSASSGPVAASSGRSIVIASDRIALFATAISSAEIDLSWSPGADDQAATLYRIWRNGAPIATVEGVSAFEDTDVSALTAYRYAVELIDAAGNVSDRSIEVAASTLAEDPAAPQISSVSTEDGPVAVNSAVTVDFSAPMSRSTLNPDTFKVETRNGTVVPGSVSMSGNTATFTPSSALPADTEHTATITTGATSSSGIPLAASFVTTFTTTAVADTTPAKVTATFPASAKTGVATNSSISATFSEAMTNSTLTTASFRLRRTSGGTPVAGTVKIAGNTATFTPSAGLAKSTQYTASLTTAARDAAGNALAAIFSWSFTTGANADTTAPRVASGNPASGSTDGALNTSVIATFSEAMKSSTMTTASFRLVNASSGALVAGTVRNFVSNGSAAFVPATNLTAGTRYTATITTAAQDAAGNPLSENFSWAFTAAGTIDATRPMVTTVSPKNSTTGVALNSPISATFSEPMNISTLTTTSVKLARTSDGVAVSGTVSVNGNTVTFTPSTPLAGSTFYTATVTNDAKDAAGNSLATTLAWSFTTAVATTTAILDWDPVTVVNLSGYRVYYGTAPGVYLQAQGQGLNVGNVTTYTLIGLTKGIRYYFTVTAFDSIGHESDFSNEVFKDMP